MTKRNLKQKKAKRKEEFEQMKKDLASFVNVGGSFSPLELVVLVCAKLDIVVRGDIHPHQQLRWLHSKLPKPDSKPKLRCTTKKDFYDSRVWQILRYQAFEKYGNRCQCCGARPSDGITLHVDHIEPRSLRPDLALDINNLQILCEDCNIGKINQWSTDWRDWL